MKIETRKLTELHSPAKNARTHTDRQLQEYVRSINMFGQIRPLVVDETGEILCGNGLYAALQKAGRTTCDCYVVTGLSSAEKTKLALADNRVFELGETDDNILAELLQDLDGDLDIPGWDEDWLSEFLAEDVPSEMIFPTPNGVQTPSPIRYPTQAGTPSAECIHTMIIHETDDHYTPAPERITPTAKRGEVYQLGRHRIMCGDATNPEDMRKLMNGATADLLLTDPPYNVNYEGAAGTILNDNMADQLFQDFLTEALCNAKEALAPGGAFYLWHAESKGYEVRGACNAAGLKIRQCLIWAKNSMVMGRQDYQWKHEPCLYGWKDGAQHQWYSDRKQTTVLEYDRNVRNDLHPTMKPIPLFDYLIRNSCAPGGIVLDPFAGSGTTIIACEQNGRTAYAMELDPVYVGVICDRYQQLTTTKASMGCEGLPQ